ncbi:MAG: carboxypeptidase regulatory-like domain-containing protein [Saprospiraceae bacterium]|nr:carboxypeptidase regulatory-like domain-containing protein [Saprospiraceae bacterium]
MKKSTFTIVFVLLITQLFAQNAANYKISGRILDENQKSVEFANIILKQAADSLLIKGSITDASGNFEIESVEAGTYFVQVSLVGFGQLSTEPFTLDDANPAVKLGDLTIAPEAKTLDQVTVRAQKPLLKGNWTS